MAQQVATGRAGIGLVLLAMLAMTACAPTEDLPEAGVEPPQIRSTAFAEGGDIPRVHTCDGEDVPPHLAWEGAHPDAVEVVLVVDDPDAPRGSFTHWLVAGLPTTGEISGGSLPPGAVEGINDFGEVGYRGPCPPPGDDPHTYRFELMAVAEETRLEPGFTLEELREATAAKHLSSGVLTGRYGR